MPAASVAHRTDEDAAGRSRRPAASGLGVVRQLPGRLLQRLPLHRQPRRPRRRSASRRLHLRVRQRRLRRRLEDRIACRCRRTKRSRWPTTAALCDLPHRRRPAGRASAASVHRRVGRPRVANNAWARRRGGNHDRGARATGRRARLPRTAPTWSGCRYAKSDATRHPPLSQLPVRRPRGSRHARHARAARSAGRRRATPRRSPTSKRSLLGAAQESWLFDQLRVAARAARAGGSSGSR